MVVVAQLVRASVCGTEGRRFEPGLPPYSVTPSEMSGFFCVFNPKFSVILAVVRDQGSSQKVVGLRIKQK